MSAAKSQPLVTVLTPVYNGEAYLAECIESVLSQTYENWEYVIVNNQSSDRTRAVAAEYAARDSRIRIVDNQEFVDVITNHNLAFAELGPDSVYCKLIQADDWMFPECVERMVAVAETDPAIGAVGSYCLAGKRVQCDGLEYPSTRVNGRDLARRTLLGELYPFWSPSVLLIRSDIIRAAGTFYREQGLHADVDALYSMLTRYDFGFVHQVLTYIRHHADSMSTQDAKRANTQRLSRIKLMVKHEHEFLDAREYRRRLDTLLSEYYQSIVGLYPANGGGHFWAYQRSELGRLGIGFSALRFWGGIVEGLITNPRRSVRRWVRNRKRAESAGSP